jgi:hypothetical protein
MKSTIGTATPLIKIKKIKKNRAAHGEGERGCNSRKRPDVPE